MSQNSENKLSISKAAKLLEGQVDKFLEDIDKEISSLQRSLGQRLQVVQADSQGQLTTEQLQLILRMVKNNSDLDETKVYAIIEKFDNDKDGKVFIEDIYRMAKEYEEAEGCGVIKDEENPKSL